MISSFTADLELPQIRNLIECSGTMPEKLQGSFSYTRFSSKITPKKARNSRMMLLF